MKVIKFGGSSLSSAESFRRAVDIAQSENKAIIVLSAIGKSNPSDEKITDVLIDYYRKLKDGDNCGALKKAKLVYEKFISIADELNASCDFYRKFFVFYDKLITNARCDFEYIVSRGEYYTCLLFCDYSKIDFIDSSNLIYFDKNGRVDMPRTSEHVRKISIDKFVTCGFYGTDENGRINLFPRGGGDSTGAVLASAANAKIFYDYTDVDGVYSVSPKISESKETIERMNYSQLYKLATHGANVFFHGAIPYIADKKITLEILNSFNANGKRTIVTDDGKNEKNSVAYIDEGVLKIEIIISHYRLKIGIIYDILKYFMSRGIKISDYRTERKKIVLIIKSNTENICDLLKKVGTNHTVSKIDLLTIIEPQDSFPFRKEQKFYCSSKEQIGKTAERFCCVK